MLNIDYTEIWMYSVPSYMLTSKVPLFEREVKSNYLAPRTNELTLPKL